MELSQLKYFLDTAQTQHITKSAQRLSIAQPALTKSIHNLEKELGVPLFMRKGRNIALTRYGTYFRDKLSPVIKALEDIPKELAQMAENEKYTIRLSVLTASTMVTQAIIDYKKKNPEINFHVLQNPENEFFDIEITTNLFSESPGAHAPDCFVCTENIFLAVPDNEKYRDKSSIKLSDVKDEGFISLFGSKQLRNICDKLCYHAGFEPNIIFESDSLYAVKNMIGAHIGVGFWPEFTWGEINASNVKLLSITDPICKRDIQIRYKRIKNDNTHSEKFYEFLKSYFEKKTTF